MHRLKLCTLSVLGAALLLLPLRLSSMDSVQVVIVAKSSRKIRFVALVDGKPQEGVKIKIYRHNAKWKDEDKARASLVSDRRGEAHVPKLAPGTYHIVVSAGENLTANLYLDIQAHSTEKVSTFSMQLVTPYPTREQIIANAEQMPIQDRIREFRGIVHDPSGGVIPGVSIEVVRKGTGGKDRVAQLESGNAGEFSARLSEGSYIAFFSSPGFETRILPFEVTNLGVEELKVTLKVGAVAEGVAVSMRF